MKKVLLFLPKGFEHMETGVFIDVLGWARTRFNHDIQLVTAGFKREVGSTFNVPIVVDKLYEEIENTAEEFDAIAIPGGFWDFGFFEEAFDERFLDLVRAFESKGKIVASICVAAIALGKSGILKGRRATTYHLDGGKRHDELRSYGAVVVMEPVVVDRKVITSYCPETAAHVAFKLLEMLTTPEQTLEVKKAMGYA